MRAGKIGLMVGRAAVVGLLTAGAWWAATAAAHAENDWQIGPADGTPTDPRPASTQTVDVGLE